MRCAMGKRRLVVLQMLPALNSGGVERGTLEVAAAIVARGHRSLVMSAGGRLVPQLESAGSEHISWPIHKKSLLTLRWVRPLRELLLRQSVDVLHVRSRVPAWIAWLALRGLPSERRPRFITTVHGLYSVNPYSAVMTRGERVIAISETVRNYLLQNYPGLSASKIQLIHRGVDPGEFPRGYSPDREWTERWNAEFPQLNGRRIITLPGRLTRYKGHPTFIEVIDRLRMRRADFHALIVGGTDPHRLSYAAEIRRSISDRGLGDFITLTGHRDDMREIYAVSDAVVSVSSNPPEAFGRTALEALCIGTPLVGFGHSGVGEILSHLYPQGLVAPGDVVGMTDRLHELLNRPRPRIESNQLFTRDLMLRKTLDLYESIDGESFSHGTVNAAA